MADIPQNAPERKYTIFNRLQEYFGLTWKCMQFLRQTVP